MENSRIFLIDQRSSLYPVIVGFIEARAKAFDSASAFCNSIGHFTRFQLGLDGYINFVDFSDCPEGWQRDVRGLCYPAHRSGVRDAIRSSTLPVPNQKLLVRTHVHAPTQIEYYEPGYEGVQSENIGKDDRQCGFLWIDKRNGPFAFWIPDLPKAVQSVESRGCTVLPYYKNWQMRVQNITEISASHWDDLRTVGGARGYQSLARKN
jgi:hypothetical protein